MDKSFPRFTPRRFRKPAALLLAYLTLVAPFAPVFAQAAKAKRASGPVTEQSGAQPGKGKGGTVGTDKRIALPAPVIINSGTPTIVATKSDNLSPGTPVAPGGTINYTVTISNTGTGDATGVQFSDTVDPNTTVVASSAVLAADDDYSTIGNVNIVVPANQGLLVNDLDVDAGNNTGMTASGGTTSAHGGVVSISSDGSFTYDPPVGYTGPDTFTYTATTSSGKTATATARITLAGRIWFVNNTAGACSSNCDGRLSHPFTTLANFQAVNDNNAALTHAKTGDTIFLYENTTTYTGPVTLLASQLLVGQDATADLLTITGLPAPTGASQLPTMNTASPAVTITSAANAINLGTNNTVRGLTVGATTGTKISGSNFGTLTVGNNSLPDVTLSGNGQALNLSNGAGTGAFAATSGFTSVATTSSTAQGINLTGLTGAVSFGSTSVSGATTQGILVGTTTADINFGNTTITGGTDGVSFQNNATTAGHGFTFGTLGVSGGTGNAFLHGAGGGNITVTGTATLSSAGSAISISSPTSTNIINFQAATSATSTGLNNTGVNWVGTSGATLTFSALTVQTNAGTGLNATTGGTVNVTNGTGTINNTAQAAPAIVANGVALNANFSAIKSSGGTNGVSLTSVTGTSNFGGGALSGATGATFLVSGGTTTVTYSGNITQANNAAAVSVSGHATGTITFQTGTIDATNGTGLQFDNADGAYVFSGTNTLHGGDAGIDILNGSGGTFDFSANSAITNPSGIGFNVGGSGNAPVIRYAGTISQANAGAAVSIAGVTGGSTAGIATPYSILFNNNITKSGTGVSAASGIVITGNSGGSIGFTGATLSLTSDTAKAVDINGSTNPGPSVTFAPTGALTISTTSGNGFNVNNAGGLFGTVVVTGSANTISTVGTGTALSVTNMNIGSSGLTFRSIDENGGTNGIVLNNTGTGGSNGGLTVTGNAGSCTTVTPTCTGGTIQQTEQGALFTSTKNVSLTLMHFLNANTTGTPNGTCNNIDDATFNNSCKGAINMSSVTTASFTNMVVENGAQTGINGRNVSGLTISNSTVKSFGNAVQENILRFFDLTGTCSITGSTFQAPGDAIADIRNDSGTLNLTVSSSTFNDTTANLGSQGLDLTSTGTATINAKVQNSTFTKIVNAAFQTIAKQTSTLNADFLTNSVDPQTAGTGRSVDISAQNSAHTNFNINGNTKLYAKGGSAVNIFGINTSVLQGHINNNTDIQEGGVGSAGTAINIHPEDNSQGIIEVNGNTISKVGSTSDFGIHAFNHGDNASQLSPVLDVTITNNNISLSDNGVSGAGYVGGLVGVFVQAGANATDTAKTCADVRSNAVTATGGVPVNGSDNLAEETREGSSTSNLYLENFVAGASNNARAIATWNGNSNTPLNFVFANDAGSAPAYSAPPAGAPYNGVCRNPSNGLLPANVVEETPPPPPTQQQTAVASNDITSHPFVSMPAPAPAKPAKGEAQAAALAHLSATTAEKAAPANNAARESKRSAPVVIMSATNVSANIGTLHAGDSVTINFQVTVNTGGNFSTVSNQGSVTGTNFTAVNGKTGTPNTNDTDNPGPSGSPNPTITQILVPPHIRVNDAKVAKPASGQTVNMLFTVALDHAYPSGVSVGYQTADGGPNPATGGDCSVPTGDYTISSGTVNFGATETVKTISVPVCASSITSDKTFLLNLTGTNTGTIDVAQATGTILANNTPGTILISEIRTSGPAPNGATNEFVELYNNTDSDITVNDGSGVNDAQHGYGLYKMGTDCNAPPVLLAVIQNTTVIKARNHFLLTGAGYALGAYATGDLSLAADIEDDHNVAVFSTADVTKVSTATRLDAVGFGTNVNVGGSANGVCDLLREGNTLPGALGSLTDYSYFRNLSTGLPADTNDNASDFLFADTQATLVNGQQRLGAPGPENKTSPVNRGATIKASLLDANVSSSISPNRLRDGTVVTNGPSGTLTIRRRFTNNTGANVTKLRFRVVQMTTDPLPAAGTADLRLLTSATVTQSGVTDATTCSAAGAGSPPCTVTVQGLTLDSTPVQTKGGGYNSTVFAGSITPALPLAPGASVNVQFTLGVVQTGSFSFFVIVEAP